MSVDTPFQREESDQSFNHYEEMHGFFRPDPIDQETAQEIVAGLSSQLEEDLTPSKIVSNLDRYIIKQSKAKRTIAQAIRNKYRMRQLTGEIKEFIRPSNIILYGKSGSGKTEIFRMISKLYNAPFIRVEATKYTEVGYYGEDINSIITELFKKTQNEFMANCTSLMESSPQLQEKVEDYILRLILGPGDISEKKEIRREQLRKGELDELQCFVRITLDDSNAEIQSMKVKELKARLYEIYSENVMKHLDVEEVIKDLIEAKGMVVIDEIDKLVRQPNMQSSSKASDEGVQYDLLPLLDGTSISVGKNSLIDTRNILFVGAGAFEKVKPTDLILELQGRMPIRTEMEVLGLEDFVKILTETENNLLDQYIELLRVEGIELGFDAGAVEEIARVSVALNEEDNIGARRLRTVLDAVLEEISFEAPDLETDKDSVFVITKDYVTQLSETLYQNRDFRRFAL